MFFKLTRFTLTSPFRELSYMVPIVFVQVSREVMPFDTNQKNNSKNEDTQIFLEIYESEMANERAIVLHIVARFNRMATLEVPSKERFRA